MATSVISEVVIIMASQDPRVARTKRTPGAHIDRTSFEPPYHQLASILRQQIAMGSLRPGDRLLSEVQLCERYGVSPMTVRRAINILLDQGLITTAQGRGTFVKPLVLGTATFGLQALEDLFSDDRTAVRILSVKTLPATNRISHKLALPIETTVISIRRLLSLDSEPLVYHREYLVYDPERPVVEAEMGTTSLRGLFDGSGETVLKRGDLSIETTVLTDEESQLLSVPAGKAAFRIEHTFYDFDDRPVSWGWFIIRGDCLRFNATVGVDCPAASERELEK